MPQILLREMGECPHMMRVPPQATLVREFANPAKLHGKTEAILSFSMSVAGLRNRPAEKLLKEQVMALGSLPLNSAADHLRAHLGLF